MKNIDIKKFYPYVLAIILFIVCAYAYFPPVLEGKIVNQSDISSWRGAANEIIEYKNKTGEVTLWTNSMFSGMPTTMIQLEAKGNYIEYIYNKLFWGPRPASYLIITFIGFFLLMLVCGVNPWLSIVGALAFGFCSYNFQIIQVGHNAKMVAMAFMPWVLASVIYAFKKNKILGAIFFAITLIFEIIANHPQITFYLAMIIIFYGCAELYRAFKNKTLPDFLKTSILLIVGAVFAFGANVGHLWPVWDYTKYTMRGGSELTIGQENQTKGGLDREYATAWSYGVGESFNMLIPNFKGGASYGALGKDSETYKFLKANAPQQADQYIKQMPLYWGEQAFTAGPMYMGAISIFLFVLGLILIKGPTKWWIVGVSVLALLLGWGRNFMFLTNFFYDYIPLYNKFRVPSMILIILQTTIPLLGFYTLNKILKGCFPKPELLKAFKIALGTTAGLCLLFIVIPSLAGSFTSPRDMSFQDWMQSLLQEDRVGLLRTDAFRSLAFICLSAFVIWMGYIKKLKYNYVVIILGVLVIADMWTVDKRYLNNSHFVPLKDFDNQYVIRPVDRQILQDNDPDYRVLDLSVDTFNDAHTSYYHKTIGGYSAAKLQRYQDIISYFIVPEIRQFGTDLEASQSITEIEGSLSKLNTLNMLNTKYIIVNPNSSPVQNRYAYGNAWFVQDYEYVNSADEEVTKLKQINPAEVAVINTEFSNIIKDKAFNYDENATIVLESYAPNRLTYKTNASNEQLALFSEVYYPKGWKVYIDGTESELFRANYILRGMIVPAGSHTITMEFMLDSYVIGAKISAISSTLLILMLVIVAIISFFRKRNRKKEGTTPSNT